MQDITHISLKEKTSSVLDLHQDFGPYRISCLEM